MQTDCILYALAATSCSPDLFPICRDYSSTLLLKCLQIWICFSVSVSSSGSQCVTKFALGFTAIDLCEFTLSLNEDWGSVTITQLHFTIHKRTAISNPFLTLSPPQTLLSTLRSFLSLYFKPDLTWQIQPILKSTYIPLAFDLTNGRVSCWCE